MRAFRNEQYYLELQSPDNSENLELAFLTPEGLELCKRYKTEQILGRTPTKSEIEQLINYAIDAPSNYKVYSVACEMSHVWTVH